MNRTNKLIVGALAAAVLAGCVKTPQVTEEPEVVKQEGVSTMVGSTAADYQVIFLDGVYPVSQTRGMTTTLSLASNISAFETGLMELSKQHFPTNQYYFLEGHFLSQQDINTWLSRKSDKTPDGLNETKEGDNDVIVTILEQDYMSYANDNYELSGVSIGLALNPIVNNYTVLSDEQLVTAGKTAADKIVKQLRQKQGFESIPIMVGLFKQEDDKGVARGKYLAYAKTANDTLDQWQDGQYDRHIFPLDNNNSTESSAFNNFKNTVQSFFPNLNGVVGEATTFNGSLVDLDITITTQFYGETEMLAFAQFLVETANKIYNTPNVSVTVKVESVRGTELTVFKKKGETVFQSVLLK